METIYEITRNLWEKYVNWMKDEKNMAKFLVCCFVLSLLPILALSFFNHPVMDAPCPGGEFRTGCDSGSAAGGGAESGEPVA